MSKHIDTTPIEVYILTADYDIKGTVYVAKYTDSNRELTDLLNDRERRFLAVTNAEILPRNSSQTPRRYNFLEVHMDYVLMVQDYGKITNGVTTKTLKLLPGMKVR